MGQRKITLASNAPVFLIGAQAYKGQQPVYAPVKEPDTDRIIGYLKVARGIPYVKVEVNQ